MLKEAFDLWKSEKRRKGTTLQHRLILFFASITMFLILAFVLLLMIFGINGKEEKAVHDYLSNELSHVSEAVSDNFGRLALLGINFSEAASATADHFFIEQNITASTLAQHPELLEPLLAKEMPHLLSVMNNNSCSGVFLLLDATIQPEAENASTARSGFYLRATQPLSVQTVGVKYYCLRGPAQVARDNGIELLGQWRMEYDITDEAFFTNVMDTARKQDTLPLSRLYYWSGRITLHGNSEASFLLCVPLRSEDGTVFGICGIEISDRMFKQLYSPKESDYDDVFAIVTPSYGDKLYTSQGLIAGNAYLTGYRMTEDLTLAESKNGFGYYQKSDKEYGGLSSVVKLYPSGSPYLQEKWSVAILMPVELLRAAIQGNSSYLFLIVIVLLIASLTASIVISRRYLNPVKKALASIQKRNYEESEHTYLEIKDLFEFLAEKDSEHEEERTRLELERQGAENKYDQVQTEFTRLADQKRREIDQESYQLFLSRLKTLTPKEREVFNLYLDGKNAKEIVRLLEFTENALKYHNKNIYSKLGVSSRKELLLYATLMKQDTERSRKS